MLNITLDDTDVKNIITGLKATEAALQSIAWLARRGSEKEADFLIERDKVRATLNRIETLSKK